VTAELRAVTIDEAEKYLNQAVDGLREATTLHHIPRGLFAHATLFRHQQNFPQSWGDLDEAREIAEYGQMRLHLADYHLEACRVINDQLSMNNDQTASFEIIENGETLHLTREDMVARFQGYFEAAERLVKETGYHRRDGEIEELRNKKL